MSPSDPTPRTGKPVADKAVDTGRVHVAVAVISAPDGRVLIARRPAHVHQGDRWEFPGGKVDAGEDVCAALRREVYEELGVSVHAARPLIRLTHDYPDTLVRLDVWRVTGYTGEAHGREGQPVRWVAPDDLPHYRFPAANRAIVTAARLPECYLITGEFNDTAQALTRLEQALVSGIRLIQLRVSWLADEDFAALAQAAQTRCRAAGATLLLNTSPARALSLGADGVHLSSARLLACAARPLPTGRWVAASVHNAAELAHAARIGCDFVVAGPVQATASHPGAATLGWAGFAALSGAAGMPVYALGGLGPDDRATAWSHGAQGVAAIRALWPDGQGPAPACADDVEEGADSPVPREPGRAGE